MEFNYNATQSFTTDGVSEAIFNKDFRWFVVELRPGATANTPGAYQEIAAFNRPPLGTTGTVSLQGHCVMFPFEPEMHELAGATFAITGDRPAESPYMCDGTLIGNIPLEDEIIDNGDQFENSWRHHLAVAAQAAEEADMLGQTLIEHGLEMDRRTETALDAVEDHCGLSLNLDAAFNPTGSAATPATQIIQGNNCPMTACPMGTVCASASGTGGLCVLDALARAGASGPAAAQLAECIGDETSVARVVMFGSPASPYCVYRSASDPSLLCPPSAGRCPLEMPPMTGCPLAPSGTTLVPQSEIQYLDFIPTRDFNAPTAVGGGTATPPRNCTGFRQVRFNVARGDAPGVTADDTLRELVASNFYSWANAGSIAPRIGFAGYPEDLGMATLDGAEWFGTGRGAPLAVGGPAATGFPCAAAYSAASGGPLGTGCTDGSGFFCQTINCADANQRASFNNRALRAMLALRVLSGSGLAGLRIPVSYAANTFDPSSMGRAPTLRFWSSTGSQSWAVASTGRFDEVRDNSMIFQPPTTWFAPLRRAWRRIDGHGFAVVDASLNNASSPQPLSFINFGHGPRPSWTQRFWQGMYESNASPDVRTYNRDDQTECYADRLANRLVVRSFYATAGAQEEQDFQALRGRGLNDGCQHRGLTSLYTQGPWDRSTNSLGTGWAVNNLHPAPDGFTAEAVLDGLEMMCEASLYNPEQLTTGPAACGSDVPVTVRSADDIPQLRQQLNCLANQLDLAARRAMIAEVPMSIVQQVRGNRVGTRPDQGTFGQSAASVRTSFRTMADFPVLVAAEVQGMATDTELLESSLRVLDTQSEIEDLRTTSTILSQTADCMTAAFNSGPATAAAAAAVQCVFAAAQIVVALEISSRTQALLGEERVQNLLRFQQNFSARQTRLLTLTTEMQKAVDAVQGGLAAIRTGTRAARRNIARAMFADTDDAGRTYNVNTVMRRRYNTDRIRYETAHTAAIRYATLARRAIEQRFGVRLADIDRDLAFVERPSSWVGGVCDSSGIDYSRIRDATDLPADNYAGEFVGDYVDRLERFVESYRLDFPYNSGADTLVASMRDDLMNVRRVCPSSATNMLGVSDNIMATRFPTPSGDPVPDEEEPVTAWAARNCRTSVPGQADACVTALPAPGDGPRRLAAVSGAPDASPYRVVFAPGVPSVNALPVSFDDDAEWSQEVTLSGGGRYRLSWYQGASGGGTGTPDVTLVPGTGILSNVTSTRFDVALPTVGGTASDNLVAPWKRYFRYFTVSRDGTFRVAIRPGVMETNPSEQFIDVAGLMLEDVTGITPATTITETTILASTRTLRPRSFEVTTAPGITPRAICEDTEGDIFRPRWAYDCTARLCDDGIHEAGLCPDPASGRVLCFWQATIPLDPSMYESGEILGGAGIALGNFNYRIDTIGLNFVGTGSRVCEDEGSLSSCYSSGYIPYSIKHLGPYTVIPYDGTRGAFGYNAPLFEGRIEMARGLAAERYIGNPISPADRSLMDPYMRSELRGRPLAGSAVIRVWDLPGVNWFGVDDIQLVLNYRYFTRTP